MLSPLTSILFIIGKETPSVLISIYDVRSARIVITVHLTERRDVFICIWILATKLVARESNHSKSLIFVFLVQLLKTIELRRETTLRGSVDDENSLSFELAQVVC